MKIIRIIARLNVGGPARHVVWLTKELNSGEFDSVLMAGTVPEGEIDMCYFASENSVEPIFIPEMSRELSPKDVISLWKVWRQMSRENPDIIHTHTAKAGTIGRTAGFLYRWLNWKKVKIVHTFHGHVFHSYYGNFKTKIFLLIEKILSRLATDKIIVITEQQFEEIHGKFKVGRKEQFEIIPLGIDLESFENSQAKRKSLREKIGIGDEEILVGFVGRLTEIKNLPLFLQVAKICKERKKPDFPSLRFVIIGDGNLRASLEKETERLELKETVKFTGNLNEADVVYAGLDIVALTSLNEGTPLSLIEAMASRKPVISTAVGGVVDLLGDIQSRHEDFQICERGVRIPPNDAESFYQGLMYLAKDQDLREVLSKKGKEFVMAKYSKERLIKDIKNLYGDLMQN